MVRLRLAIFGDATRRFAAAMSGRSPRNLATLACSVAICAMLLASKALAAAPASQPAGKRASQVPSAAEVARLVKQLDDDDFVVRRQASERLAALIASGPVSPEIEAELHRAWISPALSTEARGLLEEACAGHCDMKQAADQVDVVEIDRLIERLDSVIYSQREAAELELEPLAGRMPEAFELGERVKLGLARPSISLDARRRLVALWTKSRGTWLLAPALPQAAPVDDKTLTTWLDALNISENASASERSAAENAERQLLDLLARDGEVARVKRALNERLEAENDDATRARLTTLIDWTRPAMVAEYWQSGHHTSIQYLLVGIPSHPERAQRASHFDRCDDRSAHCVSGNSLSPGDWPVGVFFPHPLNMDSMFHLVNLPTPRRRMAYEFEVHRNERQRLAEISQQTLARWLAEKRSLDEREILMLRFLEPHAVSSFAGKYLLAVTDEPVAAQVSADSTLDLRMFGSRHGLLCQMLIERGTHEAAAGLVRASAENKILPPTDEAPYRLGWIAALAIAERDPWPDVDRWLETVLGRREQLAIGNLNPGQIGATAAGILLTRHGMAPEAFGLTAIGDEGMLAGIQFTAYRFGSSKQRERVLAWWVGFKRQAGHPATDDASRVPVQPRS